MNNIVFYRIWEFWLRQKQPLMQIVSIHRASRILVSPNLLLLYAYKCLSIVAQIDRVLKIFKQQIFLFHKYLYKSKTMKLFQT